MGKVGSGRRDCRGERALEAMAMFIKYRGGGRRSDDTLRSPSDPDNSTPLPATKPEQSAQQLEFCRYGPELTSTRAVTAWAGLETRGAADPSCIGWSDIHVRWRVNPSAMRRLCRSGARQLIAAVKAT
jgi:hypothetical protein